MKYSELLKLYKAGLLDTEQTEKVESDIERQQSISEYLFDEEQIFEFEQTNIDEEKTPQEENSFVDTINKSIRKAFIKMGMASGTVIIAIVMLIIFVVPNMINMFYYNPSTVVGKSDEIETVQMSLDMAVYTELFSPKNYRDSVTVEANGYADYDIYIPQKFYMNGNKNDVAGKLKRNKLTLYDTTLLQKPYSNAFVTGQMELIGGYRGMGAAGDANNSKELLQNLDDNKYYRAYVSMSNVKKYSELVNWCEANNIIPEWCNICTKQDDRYYFEDTLGFMYSSSCTQLSFDEEKYPYLTQFSLSLSNNGEDKAYSKEIMETHFVSMLKYMSEQKAFSNIMGMESDKVFYDNLIKNVEDNGLNIFGFTVIAQKDEILRISETEDVYYVYTENI